jgi:hypothetical protein
MLRILRLERLEDRSLLSQFTTLRAVEPSDDAAEFTHPTSTSTTTSSLTTTHEVETEDTRSSQSGVLIGSTSDDGSENATPVVSSQPDSSQQDDGSSQTTPPVTTGSTGGTQPGTVGSGSASTPVSTGSGVGTGGSSPPVALPPAAVVGPAPPPATVTTSTPAPTSSLTAVAIPVAPAPAVVAPTTTESNTSAPVAAAATSSGQFGAEVASAPVSSPAPSARSDPALARATAASGSGAAVETLARNDESQSQGFVEVATVGAAGQEASPAIAPGGHGATSVVSLAPRAGAPASGNRDFGALAVVDSESEALVPRLPGVLDASSAAAGGRRAAMAGQPSRRAGWAEALGLRGADVLTACSPYDRGAIERAIDAFLGELGGPSGSALSAPRLWSEAIPAAIVAGVALGILEMERRRSRDRRDVPRLRSQGQNDPEAPLPGFPGRRLAWSTED